MKEIEMLIQVGYGTRLPGNFPIYVDGLTFCFDFSVNHTRLKFNKLCDEYRLNRLIDRKVEEY